MGHSEGAVLTRSGEARGTAGNEFSGSRAARGPQHLLECEHPFESASEPSQLLQSAFNGLLIEQGGCYIAQ